MSKEKYLQESKPIDPSFFERTKPPPFNLNRFVYDKNSGKFCGRDFQSWGKH